MQQIWNATSLKAQHYYKHLRSAELKKGYEAELMARRTEIDSVKLNLEGLYMSPMTDDEIEKNDEEQAKFTAEINKADAYFTAWAGTLKTIKMAVDPKPNQFYTHIVILSNPHFP